MSSLCWDTVVKTSDFMEFAGFQDLNCQGYAELYSSVSRLQG